MVKATPERPRAGSAAPQEQHAGGAGVRSGEIPGPAAVAGRADPTVTGPVGPSDILRVQRAAGNAATIGLLDRRMGGPVTRVRRSPQLIRREMEGEFATNPEQFLERNVLTLDFQRGLSVRTPELAPALDKAGFLSWLDRCEQHWFVLVRDPARSTKSLNAYLLTPAVEKYAQAYSDFPVLQENKALLPVVGPPSGYIEAAYVPYFRGRAPDPEKEVGHRTIRKDETAEGFNPDFVFTATMNGCAYTVTGSASDDSFTAWHYQSPDSDKVNAARFRQERSPTDWFGASEYAPETRTGFYEAQNLLWRDENRWKIVSQVTTSQSGKNLDPVAISHVSSRPLNLDPGHEVAYTSRIIVGRAEEELETIRSRRRDMKEIEPELAAQAGLFFVGLVRLVSTEIARVKEAGDLEVLQVTLGQLKQERMSKLARMAALASGFVEAARGRIGAEQAKWFGTDEARVARLRKQVQTVTSCLDEVQALSRGHMGQKAEEHWIDTGLEECAALLSRPSALTSDETGGGPPETPPQDASGGEPVPTLVDAEGGILPEARGRFRAAYLEDLATTNAYLTEGEGQVVAAELGVSVRLFRGDTPPEGFERVENPGGGDCLIHALCQAEAASQGVALEAADPSRIAALRRAVADAMLAPEGPEEDYILSLCAAAVMAAIQDAGEQGLGPNLSALLDSEPIRALRRSYRAPRPTGNDGGKRNRGSEEAVSGPEAPLPMPSLGNGVPLAGVALLHTGGNHYVMIRRRSPVATGATTNREENS